MNKSNKDGKRNTMYKLILLFKNIFQCDKHNYAVTTITTIMNDNNRLIYPKYFAYHVIAFGTFHFDVNHYPYFFRHTHQPALISRLEVKRSINTLSTSVFGTPQVSSILNHNVKI